MKRALVTGVTGQDGSYLAELLLAKGYEVYGVVRRSSSFNTERLESVYQDPHTQDYRLRLLYGDLDDASSLNRILREIKPDEIYNLGAQSHVRVSFDVPEYTASTVAMGTLRLLEAIRESGLAPRFYQASSSEMYGAAPPPQDETTPFKPRSPYACAKVFAHQLCQNYRDAYGMFICCGILFNHECLSATTPLIIRRDGIVNVVTADEVVPLARKGRSVQTFGPSGLEVWDGDDWTQVLALTATRLRSTDPKHKLFSIEARAGVVQATAHHQMIDAAGRQLPAESLAKGDRLALGSRFPASTGWTVLTTEFAEFLGLMTAEGYVPQRGSLQFTNNDPALRERVARLWRTLFLGSSRTDYWPSGFNPDNKVGQLHLTGGRSLCEWLRSELYTPSGYKRVPPLILNSRPEAQRAYLDGYYAGDGLKAGNGDSIKTNSAVLAQGLCWLYSLHGRSCSVYMEQREERRYYQLNVSTAMPQGDKGQHLRRDPAELRRLEAIPADDEWVIDLETKSGRLCAGVGRLVVHNSPRRGIPFVTRKITRAAARIRHGLDAKVFLGNLDALRDWGFAGDYVEAMWLMLQQDKPDDYVIATGESHTVREVLDIAFGALSLDWKKHVEIDPRYFRPTEVDHLRGNADKARRELAWKPKVKFRELIEMMVQADEADVRSTLAGRKPSS